MPRGVRKNPQPCGTYAAWWRHRRHGETPCEPCQVAYDAWNEEQRAKPGYHLNKRVDSKARRRAMVRLTHLHPDEFERLRAEELVIAQLEEG